MYACVYALMYMYMFIKTHFYSTFVPHRIVLFPVCLQLGMGVAAVVGPHNRDLSTHVHSVCSRLEVPYIRTGIVEPRTSSGQTRPDEFLFAINVHPSASQLNKAYLSLIRFYRWTMFCIVFA